MIDSSAKRSQAQRWLSECMSVTVTLASHA